MKLAELKRALTERLTIDFSKRNGLVVKRPVLNAQDWYDWAVKHGVPEPVSPEKMHVTVVYLTEDMKMKPRTDGMTIQTSRAFFAMFGEDDDVLVVAFQNWELYDRHLEFLANGAMVKWSSYRPHMTLSYSADGFELSDEALREAPDFISLGAEVFDEPKADWDAAKTFSNPEGFVGENLEVVEVSDSLKDAAGQALYEAVIQKTREISPVDEMALYEIAASGRTSRGVLKRLTEGEGALEDVAKARGGKEVTFNVKRLSGDVAKSLGLAEGTKANDEERMITVIASVSNVNGKPIKDYHGDTITTQALIEYSRQMVTGHRASQIDHDGNNRLEVVQSLMLSDELQKALGIDLGYEPLIMEVHVPEDEDWAEVKKHDDWGASIRARMFYEDA